MFLQILLILYFKTYSFYKYLWKHLFLWINKIMIIYYVEKNTLINITWNYYLGWMIDKYQSGTYYVKIFDTNGINYIAFHGHLSGINYITHLDPCQNPPRRKNIILLNNEKSLNINLEILDNYKMNIDKFSKDNAITNLKKIMTFLGFPCTHVKIIKINPYSQKIIKIDDIDIEHLYELD